MRFGFGVVLAVALAGVSVVAHAAPIIYHVDYENNGVLLIGTITTDGKLGTLASEDIVDVHLLVSNNGLPGFILLPWGYTMAEIESTAVTATAQGLYFDTSKGGYLRIDDNLYGDQWLLLQGNTMTIEAVGEPIAGNYLLATVATPPRPPVPAVKFRAEADAIFGSVTNQVTGALPTSIEILPQNQTGASNDYPYTGGPNHATDPTNLQTLFGLLVYNFRSIDNVAQTDYTVAVNDGIAEAKTGEASLLNGLIYWQGHDDKLSCKPDANIPDHIDCAGTETITGLMINRVPVHHGKYPAGTVFPVFGPVTDPNCQARHENFNGYLITQESQITGLGTSAVTLSLTGMHLVGEAVCDSAKSGGTGYTTHYDLSVGGPSLPGYDTRTGNSAPPNTSFSVLMQ